MSGEAFDGTEEAIRRVLEIGPEEEIQYSREVLAVIAGAFPDRSGFASWYQDNRQAVRDWQASHGVRVGTFGEHLDRLRRQREGTK